MHQLWQIQLSISYSTIFFNSLTNLFNFSLSFTLFLWNFRFFLQNKTIIIIIIIIINDINLRKYFSNQLKKKHILKVII